MLKEALRPAWAEISLSNLDHNIKQVQKKVGNREIIGVVKADAYGHGAIAVSKVLLENGVKSLAVATPHEAAELREAGIACSIIMVGLVPEMYANTLLEHNIIPITATYRHAEAISNAARDAGSTIDAFVVLDTGMGRLGFLPNEESIKEIIKINNLPNLKIKGMLSHFAAADEKDKTYTNNQVYLYKKFLVDLKKAGVNISYRSIGNSAAVMDVPDSYFDAVRPGIILYGCYPSSEADRSQLDIKPVMSIKANIIYLKKIPAGYSISYGRKFTTNRESLIATLTLGYADGYPRLLSGKGRVIINGVYAPVVGAICMDQCMVDVTDVPNVCLGSEVVVMGRQGDLEITADEIAEKTETINYEIICGFGQRLPKVYVK